MKGAGALLEGRGPGHHECGWGEMPWCARKDNATPSSKDVHILIARNCKYGTLQDKRDFAAVSRKGYSGGEGMLDYSGGHSVISRILVRGSRGSESEKAM